METISEQKYIKIFKLDPALDSAPRYARSLEKYLEKNNWSFNIVDGDYIVHVNDKNKALRMSFDLVRYKIEYFDGVELSLLDTKPDGKKGGRPINTVIDYSSNKSMTCGQFSKSARRDIELDCLAKGEVIKRKLLTKKEIETAISWGKLKPIKFRNKEYFDRQEIFDYLKSSFYLNY